jgi:hypothetical protein
VKALVHVHNGLGARLATLQNATVLERSYVRNDAGAARFSLPQDDLQATASLIGADYVYVLESDAGLPPWIGFLPGRWTENGQTVTLVLRELTAVLSNRFTGSNDIYTAGAGQVLRGVLQRANVVLPHPFEVGSFSDAGPYQAKTYRHASVLDGVAKPLANETGYEFWADYDVTSSGITAVLNWSSRRDHDRSSRVLLEEGRNLADSPIFEDRTGQPVLLSTAVGSTSSGTSYAQRPIQTVAAATTVRATVLGTQTIGHDEFATDARSATASAAAALSRSDGRTLKLAVTDPALWPELVLGADVRVRLPRYNLGRGLDTRVRIVGVQPDEDAGVLTLSVEVA